MFNSKIGKPKSYKPHVFRVGMAFAPRRAPWARALSPPRQCPGRHAVSPVRFESEEKLFYLWILMDVDGFWSILIDFSGLVDFHANQI